MDVRHSSNASRVSSNSSTVLQGTLSAAIRALDVTDVHKAPLEIKIGVPACLSVVVPLKIEALVVLVPE